MADVKKIGGYNIKDETARNALANIGSIVTGSAQSFSVANAGMATIAKISLPAGNWVVTFSCGLPKTSSSGYRCKKGYVQMKYSNVRQGWNVTDNDDNASFYVNISGIVNVSSTTTVNVEFLNFGGATMTYLDGVTFKAIRIA